MASDLGIQSPTNGNLTQWAQQGVFLLNTVLTVRDGQANSHKKKGWERFTDVVIQKLNEHPDGVVFLLWGKPAEKKAKLIDQARHKIIVSPHPSPLSAHRGFFDSKPFSQVNEALKTLGRKPINWAKIADFLAAESVCRTNNCSVAFLTDISTQIIGSSFALSNAAYQRV